MDIKNRIMWTSNTVGKPRGRHGEGETESNVEQ